MSFVMVFFSSCIGVHMDITVRNNGTGTIALEYRISRTAESLGKLDGNENWFIFPVGRVDFERTINRIDGLTLNSFAARSDEKDQIIKVALAFSNLDALSAFLDYTGQQSRIIRENGTYRLSLTLGGDNNHHDPELLELTETVFEGYTMELGFTFPRNTTLILMDGSSGRNIDAPPVGEVLQNGRNIRFAASMADLLSSREPVVMEIRW
jgi:hypothetical protein